MMLPCLLRRLLVLGLLAIGFRSWAEPIYPLLSPAALGQLRTRLYRSGPDTNRVRLLLQLSDDLLARHHELGTALDSAGFYCQQASRLSEKLDYPAGRIGSLYALGRWQLCARTDTAGRGLLQHGIWLSQQQRRPRLEALGWYYLGEDYSSTNQEGPLKIACFERARRLYQQLGSPLEATYLLKAIADVHLNQGKLTLGINELHQVLVAYRAAGCQRLHYTYDLLHWAYEATDNHGPALRYELAAIECARAARDTVTLGKFYENVAFIYQNVGEDTQSLVFYRKAALNAQLTNQADLGISASGNVARLLIARHQPRLALAQYLRATRSFHFTQADALENSHYLAECYMALGRYQLAEQWLLRSVSDSTSMQNGVDDVQLYQSLGKLYFLTKQYDKARRSFGRALRLRQTGHTMSTLTRSRFHWWFFRLDSAQGRLSGAIGHYQLFKLQNDSLLNEKNNKQLASLQVQYDTHKKEQNIALLTKQSQVQQARLRQREWQRNALLGGAILLALLLGLGYNRYRLKQRATQLLQAQQQEINRKNASLEVLVSEKQHLLEDKENLLQEKDWMLKEIHHRVKNNLQVISSLLSTQADYLRDPAALAALRESQNRVQAMALIHQKLYQSDSVALVNMQEYIREITERLLESFDCLDTVREQLAIAPVELDVALATPLGLIINEAITNALKHAFPAHRAGTLTIGLQPLGAHRYELLIADDGLGLPPGFDPARSQSLGLTMVKGLSKQLDGVLTISSEEPGVQVTLQFEVARKQVRAAKVLV